ncbi:MAG: RNA-binding S4 domain-containing protein [Solirubrobacterales bacterium]
MDGPQEIPIRGEMIRLGQLCKLADVTEGVPVKELLAGGAVYVNGVPESRRGRQLHPGDSVRVGDVELLVPAGG